MTRTPSPLPPGLGDVFRVGRALDEGATSRRLRASDLEAPFHGVRRIPASPSPEDHDPLAQDRATFRRVLRDARAYAEVMPAGAFFVGRTAAILHGLPLEPGAALEVGVRAPSRAPRAAGVHGVKVAGQLVSTGSCAGVPVTSPASTWAMLGRDLTVRQLVVVGDAIVRVPRGRSGIPMPEARLATVAQLAAAAHAGSRRGSARLREALELVRPGSMSPLETEFRLDAAAAGLPAPELDGEIRDARGRLLGISEFVYRPWRVVVEVEGDHHRTSRAQWHRDLDKYAAYAAEGWEVVRVTSRHIRSGSAVRLLRDALARRAAT